MIQFFFTTDQGLLLIHVVVIECLFQVICLQEVQNNHYAEFLLPELRKLGMN